MVIAAHRRPTLVALFVSLCYSSGYGLEKSSITELENAWKARQARVRSARFSWNEVDFIAAHSHLPPRRGDPRPITRDAFVPDQDLVAEKSAEVALRENMLRYTYDGAVFNPAKGGLQRRRYVSVFDGAVAKNFHHNLHGDQADFPTSGFIRDSKVHYDMGNPRLVPVLTNFRPLDLTMDGVDLIGYEIATKSGIVDGRSCYIVRPRASVEAGGGLERSYWVDPNREYIVLRAVYAEPGGPPRYTIDIKYSQDDQHGWIPSGWKIIEEWMGAVIRQSTATFVKYHINPELAKAAFQFEFPPNTAVVDNRTNERFIARPNSAKRIVTKQELARGATYSDLVATESGKARVHDRRKNASLGVVVTLSVIIITLCVIVGARWKAQR